MIEKPGKRDEIEQKKTEKKNLEEAPFFASRVQLLEF